MTKKTTIIAAFHEIFNKLKIFMILTSILLLIGTLQASASPGMPNIRVDLSGDLQQKQVSGKIIDRAGDPLIGVNVTEKGTTNGTISDPNGNFAISLASANSILSFSFIGYTTQDITVGSQSTINITLFESMSSLDEVLVVGYSTQTKKSLTGAIASVNSTALSDGTSANTITRLQGKVSGVSTINSHTPGGDAIINIRGLGTINNNSPLFVIDGVPTKSGISQINPNEIESVTVLKDATSAAIYGARGANGVVIITTKRGTPGKTKVSFTARYGSSSFNNAYDLLNAKEYGEMLWIEAKNEGKVPSNILYGSGTTPVIPDYVVPAGKMEGDPLTDPSLYNYNQGADFYNITRANKEGTDWYNVMLQRAPMKEYNLSLSNGSEKGSYAFNIGYYTEDGIIKFTSFDRYSIRSNADIKVNSWLKVGESLGITYSMGKGNRSDNDEGTPISQGYRMQPIIPIYDIMGNFAGTKATGAGDGSNPLAELTRDRDDFEKNLRGIGNVYADFQIIKGLNFKSLFGFDYRANNGRDISRIAPESQESIPADNLNMTDNYIVQWNWANTLNYTKAFGSHTLNVLVGTEALENTYFQTSAFRSTFSSDDVLYMYLDAGEKDKDNTGSGFVSKTFSYFGRFNYDYKDKYLVELTVRRDGSSMFGSNNRWGNFPAASFGWRVSEESFMSGIKSSINNLKIRGGYGVSGNDELGGAYNGYSTYAIDPGSSFYSTTGGATTSSAGFFANRIGNPNAKWETTSTLNLGIDVVAFKNTLTATLDIWQRKTKDMLFRTALPDVVGGAIAPSINIGDMNNKGFDLGITYANKAMNGDITYGLGLTLSHYKNEVVKISNNEAEFISGADYREMKYTRATKGTSFPEYYGLIVDGYFESEADAASYPASYGTYNLPGHFKFRDVNNDGVVDDNDRTYIGSPHPKFTAGMNMDIGYKAFNLSAFWYTSYGNKLVNYVKRWIDYAPQAPSNKSKDRLYRSWGSPYLANNADAVLPLADGDITSQYPSTAFLEDGSFLRLKTLQLSYTLPEKMNQKLMINNLQIYVQGTNILTFTKYKGLDPEVNSSGVNLGIDAGQWPTARQIVFGIKLDL